MITVTGRGWYWSTKKPMLLMLENEQEGKRIKTVYRCILANDNGRIRLIPQSEFKFTDEIVSGRFRMYETVDEEQFTNGTHLELCREAGKWNCYVMPDGLPDEKELQKEYFRTNKCVTKCYCSKN